MRGHCFRAGAFWISIDLKQVILCNSTTEVICQGCYLAHAQSAHGESLRVLSMAQKIFRYALGGAYIGVVPILETIK